VTLPFYVEADLLGLGFDSASSPGAAPYVEQMAEHAQLYYYMQANASNNYAANTYNRVVEVIASMTPEEKARPWMLNIEYPWLEILEQLDTEGIDPAWESQHAATLQEEADRLSMPKTTLAEYKALAIKLWQDLSDLAIASGCPFHVHYGAAIAFQDSVGVPYGARRSTPFSTGMHRVSTDPVYYMTMRERFDLEIAGGKYRDLAKAQSHAPAHGIGSYCLLPNGTRVEESGAIPLWSTSAIRYDENDVAQSHTFDAEQNRLWVQETSRRMTGEYKRAMDRSYELGMITADERPSSIHIITFGPFIPAFGDSAISWQHWNGVGMKDIDKTITDEIMSLFLPANADSSEVYAPDGIWWWCDVSYYFRQLVTNQYDTGGLVAFSRWSAEVDWLGRPALVTSGPLLSEPEKFGAQGTPPVGYTSWWSYHKDFATTHSMGNSWWNSGVAGFWYTVAGGSQLPEPCVLDENSPLAPYLDFTHDITRDHVVAAIPYVLSDKSVEFVKRAAAALSTVWRRSIMTYDNTARAVTDVTFTTDAATYSYAPIDMVPGLNHDKQLVVDWTFTHDRNGVALSTLNLTMDDRRQLFSLPSDYWTVDQEEQTITIDGDMSARTVFTAEDGTTTVEYPDVDLDVDGQSITIRRQTVSNVKLASFITGKIDVDRLNRSNTQWWYLLQEVLNILDHDVIRRSDLSAADGPIAASGYTIPFASLPPIRMQDLDDVDVTGLLDTYVLSWDAGTSTWVPTPMVGGGGGNLPAGGTAGQLLEKLSGVDGDAHWVDADGNTVIAGIISDLEGVSTTVDTLVTTVATGVLNLTGGTMVGPLVLATPPYGANWAATKAYVDARHGEAYNLIMNPSGFWNQRQRIEAFNMTGFRNLGLQGREYYLDQWYMTICQPNGYSGNLAFRIEQDTAEASVAPTRTGVKCAHYSGTTTTGASTATMCKLAQRIEGPRGAAAFASWGAASPQDHSISGYIKASHTGNACVCISVTDGTDVYTYTTQIAIAAADTWQSFTISLDGLAAMRPRVTSGLWAAEFAVVLYAGSDYHTSANTWVQTTAGDSLGLAQFINGSTNYFQSGRYVSVTNLNWTATDFVQQLNYSPSNDLQELLRYYAKSYDYATRPGTASTWIGRSEFMSNTVASPGIRGAERWPIPMATAPTIKFYSPYTGNAGYIYKDTSPAGSGNDILAVVAGISETGYANLYQPSGTNFATNTPYLWHWEAAAKL